MCWAIQRHHTNTLSYMDHVVCDYDSITQWRHYTLFKLSGNVGAICAARIGWKVKNVKFSGLLLLFVYSR